MDSDDKTCLKKLLLLTCGRDTSLTLLELRESLQRYGLILHSWEPALPGDAGNIISHPCLIQCVFKLRDEADYFLLCTALENCILIRCAYSMVFPRCGNFQVLCEELSRPENAYFVHDATYVGRRLRGKAKAILLENLNRIAASNRSGKLSVMHIYILADMRHLTRSTECDVPYFAGTKFCDGGSHKWGKYIKDYDAAVFLSEGVSGNANATTRMDFVRCFLASNVALVGFGDMVLDPFAGSGALPIAAELFGATAFSADILPLVVTTSKQPCREWIRADATRLPWRCGSLDAIVCDPPYGMRTALLPPTPVLGNVRGGCDMLFEVLRIAQDLLVDGGRLALWWFEKCDGPALNDLVREYHDSHRALSNLSLQGLGYDDFGLGSSLPCQESELPHFERNWRRCLLVFQKGHKLTSPRIVAKANLAPVTRTLECDIPSEVCQEFLKASWQGNTQLFQSIALTFASNDSIVKLCNIVDAKGNTPLILAAGYGKVAAVRWLLEHNADPNVVGPSGTTALIRAARFGHYDCVGEFLRCECLSTISACDDTGFSALAYALAFQHICVLRVLPQHLLTENTLISPTAGYMMHVIARWGCVSSFLFIVASHQNCSELGTEIGPSLSSSSEALTSFEHLVNVCLPDGTTPLHLAARYGHVEMCRLLVRFGAHVNAEDSCGNQPHDLARIWQTNPAKIFVPGC